MSEQEILNELDIPVLALRGINVFPKMFLHFDAKRPESVKALDIAMKNKQLLFVVAQKDASIEAINMTKDVYTIGTLVKVKQVVKLPGNISRVLVEGISRAKVVQYVPHDDHFMAQVELMNTEVAEYSKNELDAVNRMIDDLVFELKQLNSKISKDTISNLIKIPDVGHLADAMTTHFIKPLENKQRILEEINEEIRIQLVIKILNTEIEVGKIQKSMHRKVKSNIDKNQKEYYLREQLKVIQNELGDKVDTGEEIEDYKRKIEELQAATEVKDKLYKELNRLKKMNSGSSEGAVVRNYLDTILEMPWDYVTEESMDLAKANEVLQKDHYGLTKVKERVLEHLAVRKMTNASSAPIICLVGPPGTGKTSIAKSIASAMERNYVRISLGGVRDEAEIRGHRRTYIGAMPGRLVNGLKQAKSSNPLILLDEIDKMSSDFKGDPSAALLEVLDSEQNYQFRDHYVELPVDLSKVLFVATANTLRTVPRPLLDRLEIIEVASYTENEKYHIATEYLWPKQLKTHGLKKTQVKITKSAILQIITQYTREAGVRQLERRLGEICRKAVKALLIEDKKSLSISGRNIEEHLGIPKFLYQMKNIKPQVGVARGLAWTEVGGDTLSIEVTVMQGKGNFQLTGRIGDVMKESASAAISYIRANSKVLNLEDDFYENTDIHIHIPEGAVPKDGPSAGITLAISVISALTEIPIRNDIAMTGEITLRGRVLPIGGLKEKILAAKRAGIFEIIVPTENKRNVSELDEEILEGMTIHFVEKMEQVITLALVK